jgi:hypothetical protein
VGKTLDLLGKIEQLADHPHTHGENAKGIYKITSDSRWEFWVLGMILEKFLWKVFRGQ